MAGKARVGEPSAESPPPPEMSRPFADIPLDARVGQQVESERTLGTGERVTVHYDRLDGPTVMGWTMPSRYRVEASGGPLPYDLVLHVEVRHGQPSCRRLEVVVPEDQTEGLQRNKLRDLAFQPALDAAARMALSRTTVVSPGHYRVTIGVPGIESHMVKAGMAVQAGKRSDEELQRLVDLLKASRLAQVGRGALKAAIQESGLSNATFRRRMEEAQTRGLIAPSEWPVEARSKGTT